MDYDFWDYLEMFLQGFLFFSFALVLIAILSVLPK